MRTPEPGDYVRVDSPKGEPWWGTVIEINADAASVRVDDRGSGGAVRPEDLVLVLRKWLTVAVRPAPAAPAEERDGTGFLGMALTGTSLAGLKTPLAAAIVIEGLDEHGRLCHWRLRSADTPPSHALGLHDIAAARYRDRNDR